MPGRRQCGCCCCESSCRCQLPPLHAPLPDAHARLCFVLPEALLIDGNMWDDAVITQKAKVKTLEDKFSAKMLENGVGVITCTSSVTLLFVFPVFLWLPQCNIVFT